jgi:hypothetical protein
VQQLHGCDVNDHGKIDQFAAVVLIADGPGHLLLAAHQAWISVPVHDLSYVIKSAQIGVTSYSHDRLQGEAGYSTLSMPPMSLHQIRRSGSLRYSCGHCISHSSSSQCPHAE